MSSTLNRRAQAGYALGGVASGTFGTVPGLLLMPFLTEEIGIGASLAGVIVFAPKAWDIVMNPIAGRISDRLDRRDRRRPFLITAGPAMALCFALMFSGPAAPMVAATLWVFAFFLVSATAYALFQVPYLAMSAEMTDDYDTRSSVMAWRVAVVTICIMASGAVAPLLVTAGGEHGHRLMGWVVGAVIAAGAVAVWHRTGRFPIVRREEATGRLVDQFRVVLGNRFARPLVVGFALQAVATSMLLASIAYAARHVIGDATAASLLFVTFVLGALAATPVWSRGSRRWGKRRGFLVASATLTLGLVALTASITGTLWPVVVASVVVGAGYAGTQLFPLSMLGDIAAHDAAETGHNRIGMYAGTWAGIELLGFALGPGVLGLLLAIGGYESGGVAQDDGARWAIVAGIAIVPAALTALSLVAIARYRLDDTFSSGARRPSSQTRRPYRLNARRTV